MFVCVFGEINGKDEMPRSCIFTSDFYSVSDLSKRKIQNQMDHGMENKQQKIERKAPIYKFGLCAVVE